MSNKSKNPWKTKPRFAKTGYGLHVARLVYTGKESIRSFKIPLKNKNQAVFNEFVGKIKNDYINQVGLLNLSDWCEYRQRKQGHYSLADFWLDSLRAGVIFAPSINQMNEIISSKRESFVSTFRQTNPQACDVIDVNKLFTGIISKTGQRKTKGKTRDDFIKSFIRKYIFSEKQGTVEAKQYAELITDNIFGSDITTEKQSEFWKTFTGFQVAFTKEQKINAKGYSKRFIFLPAILFTPDLGPKELISKYKDWFQDNQSSTAEIDESFYEYLGLDKQFNPLSEYFNLDVLSGIANEPDVLVSEVMSFISGWSKKEKELKKRVSWLFSRVPMISRTNLASPHEYRSTIGGKCRSWVSNYLRQEREIKNQLFGFDEVGKRGELTGKFIDGNKQELEKIVRKEDGAISNESAELASECLLSLGKLKNNIDDAELGLYRRLIGELRVKLNIEFQDAYPELEGKTETEKNKDARNKRADKRYPKIFRDIKLVPNFLGETKRVVYKKFIRSADIIHEGIAFVDHIDRQIPQKLSPCFENDEALVEFTERQFETLRRKYYLMNHPRFQHVISKIIASRKFVELKKKEDDKWQTFVDSSFALSHLFLKEGKTYKDQEYYAFHINPKARNQRRTTIILDIDKNNAVKILQDLIRELKPKWEDIIKGNNAGELIDAIEIEKVRLGILIALYHKHKFKIKKDLLSPDLFESAHQYLQLENNPKELSGTTLGRLLQSMVCAEVRGAINKISRAEYVERFIAQPINSEANYPLLVHRSLDSKITWHTTDKKFLNQKKMGVAVQVKMGKDFSGLANSYKEYFVEPENIFDLVSSKYHLQFLTKTLEGGGNFWWKRKKIALSASSHSFIVEQKVKLCWGVKDKTLEVVRSQEKHDNNLYVSIPFVIRPQKAKADLTKRTCYMGIDVGEYGLAWTVIDIDVQNKKVHKVLKQGFIYEPLTHKVRNYVATIKDNQVGGTFGMPDTKLARLRENAITSLRNQVHDIAMRYDAKPVYEREISNFETGSNKVKVVYDSVKRADTGRGPERTDAENAEADLVWGNRSKKFGGEVDAYATSYICGFCGHSPYREFENSKLGDETRAKDKLHQERKLSRPSLEDFLENNPIYQKCKGFSKYKNDKRLQRLENKDGEWKTHRGNTAIYVCQNCRSIFDADIQASYWIALKQAVRDFYKDKETTEGLIQEKGKKKEDELTRLVVTHEKNKFVTFLNLDLC